MGRKISRLFVIPASLGASLCASAPLETPTPRVVETVVSTAASRPANLDVDTLQQMRERGKRQAAEAAYDLALLSMDDNNKGRAIELIREAAFLQPTNTRYLTIASRLEFELHNYKMSEFYLFRLLAIYRTAPTPDNLRQAMLFDELATLYRVRGQKRAERSALLKGLAIKEAAFGKAHPYIVDNLYRLAALDLISGNLGESKDYLQRAFDLLETSTENIDNGDMATAFHNIGDLYGAAGQYEEAGRAYRKALLFWNREPERNHRNIATTSESLARIQAMQSSADQVRSANETQEGAGSTVIPYSPEEGGAEM